MQRGRLILKETEYIAQCGGGAKHHPRIVHNYSSVSSFWTTSRGFICKKLAWFNRS
jgi:hypothetical protein